LGVKWILNKPFSHHTFINMIDQIVSVKNCSYKTDQPIPKNMRRAPRTSHQQSKEVIIDIIGDQLIEVVTTKDLSVGGASFHAPQKIQSINLNKEIDLVIPNPQNNVGFYFAQARLHNC